MAATPFSEELRKAVEARSIDIEALAARCDQKPRTVHAWMRGERRPRVQVLEKVMESLGLSFAEQAHFRRLLGRHSAPVAGSK